MVERIDLLERMRRSKGGWRPDDLARLYSSFGFDALEGAKHKLYIHPIYPDLRATVTHSSTLPVGYVSQAVRIVDELRKRLREADHGNDE